MPALKDLSIIIDYPRSSEIDLPLEAFTGASHVTTLNLTPICHLTLPHPWPLTNLTIDCGQDNGACYSPCIGTILACKNTLRTCTILSEFGRMLALQHSPREPTKFPCLETLDLRQAAMDFCELIACPNLRSLRLSAWTLPESVRPFEALHVMLKTSSDCKTLRSLTLEGLPYERGQDFTACMQRLPNLIALTLKNDDGEELLLG
ncbi:hypothetical protein BD626DRAFT_483900 [Schizophyllum amplum]|uniref:F-box domain-containing protein n=1 Tax=Schizophyllum amplum TaxID=97359 RepID=A0A550CPZ3_9AGAR|nr:hypothetical protein BD626DRAFT_483900 [Auriculariopsis ampla]